MTKSSPTLPNVSDEQLTFSDVARYVRALGFTLSKQDGEYRLCPKGAGEAKAYYSDDLTDIAGTCHNWK
jgi:hypothetical protein